MIAQSAIRSRRGGIVLRLLLWAGGGVLLLLGVLLCIYMFFGWRAKVNLDRKVAALIAAGEPLSIELIQPQRVDDSINAEADIRAAIALLPGTTDASTKFNDLRDGPEIPLRDEERAILIPYVAESADARAALRKALDKPRAVSQLRMSSPLLSLLLPQLQSYRQLANACGNSAYIEYDAGRHGNAIDALRPIEPLSRVCGSGPTLVNALVSIGMRGVRAARLIEFAPELKIGSGSDEVPPEMLAGIIADLLDPVPPADEFKLAMKGERLIQLDTFINLAGGTISTNAISGAAVPSPGAGAMMFLSRPLLYSNAGNCLDLMTDYIAISNSPDWPTARQKLQPLTAKIMGLTGSYTQLFTRMLLPSLDRAFETHFRGRTESNLAATALAIRWYQTEHNGQLPKSLDELVPKYLPAVPTDYLSGKPLHYRPAGEQPIIWSVGENGTDDDGSRDPANPKRQINGVNDRWSTKDAVVFLKRQPRPASQPAE